MMCSLVKVILFVGVLALIGGNPSPSKAQSGGFAPRWPDTPMPPSTGSAAPPAGQATPAPAGLAPAQAQEAHPDSEAPPPVQKPKPATRRSDVVQCQGPFAHDTSEAKLIAAFGAKNVVFEEVSGSGGTKLNATVLFPNDPKRRLEVLWIDEETRTKPASIVIEGGSGWLGPKGVKIGTPLSDVERLNGKSFKLSGFGTDNGGHVTDWQNGAMTKLPGGCALGIRFGPGEKTPSEAQEKVAGDRTLSSNEGAVRAARPKVTEIFVGYAP
jgi:hypothetical protein